jgi:tripartite-type tricarboxylate transporter receptor subunit TctC
MLPMKNIRTSITFCMALSCALSGLAAAPLAHAEVAGGKTVSLVVSYPPGGGADLVARLIAPKLSEALGQPVIVENRPGAGGLVAGAYVAKSTPDGATLFLDAANYAVAPSLYKMPYDSATAFTPIGVVALFPNVLVVYPGFPAKNVADVLAMAKAKPATIAFASSGSGSAQHLSGALFEDIAKISLVHVPYRGGGPAMNDVMGGQVPLFFANVASSIGQIRSGRMRPLAVTGKTRSSLLPDIPTMQEAGVTGYEVYEWNPVLAPAGIDADTKRQLLAAMDHALNAPDVRARIVALGGEPFTGGPVAADKFLREQAQLWSRVIRERNIKAE